MASQALVVGIGDYPDPPGVLEGAVPEAKNWIELLSNTYRLPVRFLLNAQATPGAVTAELKQLLAAASADDDRLVFVYCGHGDKINGKEALILHPNVPFTETQFARVVEPNLKKGVFTIVLETCYSGGFRLGPAKRAFWMVASVFGFTPQRVLSPPERLGEVKSFKTSERFGAFKNTPESSNSWPLIVAACEEGGMAAQLTGGPLHKPRMLFSSRAIPELTRNSTLTHEDLCRAINPLDPTPPGQNAAIYGNRLRESHPFFT